MKVLHAGSSMPTDWGGIERYVATLANAQARSGDEVMVVAPAGSPLDTRCDVPTTDIILRRKFDLRALRRYLRLFRRHKFDVVVTHFSPDYVIPALAARLAGGGKTVLTRHLVEPFRRDRALLYSRLYDGFLGVSRAAAGSLIDSGLPPDQIRSVHGGCHPLTPHADRTLSRTYHGVRGFAVGYFGRLVTEKGVDVLIEARRKATENWSVHVFGDGPEWSRLHRAAEGCDVTFHGRVDDVGSCMDAMDVVVLPSRWSEAFSIAALEALSIGKPIVASNVGGLPELFDVVQPGKLVVPGDAANLAEAVDAYARRPDDVSHDGQTGASLYCREYTPMHMASRIRAAYLELIA